MASGALRERGLSRWKEGREYLWHSLLSRGTEVSRKLTHSGGSRPESRIVTESPWPSSSSSTVDPTWRVAECLGKFFDTDIPKPQATTVANAWALAISTTVASDGGHSCPLPPELRSRRRGISSPRNFGGARWRYRERQGPLWLGGSPTLGYHDG
jgi:hypothetical protein